MSNYASLYGGLPYTYTSNPTYLYYLQQTMQQAQQQQQYYAQLQQQRIQQQLLQQQQLQQQAALQAQTTTATAATDTYTAQTAEQVPDPNGCTDGKDDGKISFWDKVKNFGKGVGNFFKGMVCDEKGFSLKRTLTSAAMAVGAIVLTFATSGAAAPYLVAAGAAMSGVEIGKGVYKAATAKTDAEAKLAYQSIGSGTTGLGLSIAGAKGALNASGAAVPKGNAITSSLRATWDCMKIAGKGTASASKAALLHPMQSARSIGAYWQNTMKPNLNNMFSFKTAHKNYTSAMEESLNKERSSLVEQRMKLNDELTAHPEKAVELNGKIAEIDVKIGNIDGQIASNTTAKNYASIKEQIEQRIADPSTSEAEKAILQEQLLEANSKVKNMIKAYERQRLDDIASLKEQIKTATGDTKTLLEQQLKVLETQNSAISAQAKIEIAQYNVENANSHIAKLQAELKAPGLTDAQKASINSRIAKIEQSVAGSKQILRNQNMLIGAKQTIPQVALPFTAYRGATTSTIDNLKSEIYSAQVSAYNQLLAEQQAAIQQTQQQQQQALAEYQQQQQQAAQQTATNPYGQLPVYPPMGTGLDFNSLYVSPFPDVM